MSDRVRPSGPGNDDERVTCEVCLKAIPHSEAQVHEAQDYVLYFCGLGCYGRWRERADSESSSTKPGDDT